MLKPFFVLLALAAAFGEEDPWIKVRELAKGAELRIYKTGEKQPVAARFDSLSQDSLIVVRKNAQVAMAKDLVERVDCRPADSGGRIATDTRRVVGTKEESLTGRSKDTTLPPRSTSSSVRIQPRRGFETVYQRPGNAPRR